MAGAREKKKKETQCPRMKVMLSKDMDDYLLRKMITMHFWPWQNLRKETHVYFICRGCVHSRVRNGRLHPADIPPFPLCTCVTLN